MSRKQWENKSRKRAPESYRERQYRIVATGRDLVGVEVRVEETDLHITADREVGERAKELVLRYRLQLQSYINRYPLFRDTLLPMPIDPLAPPLVRDMLEAGSEAGVGPMAAVAGAIAQYVGEALRAEGVKEIVVENGGDIFVYRSGDCTVSIFAGESPLS